MAEGEEDDPAIEGLLDDERTKPVSSPEPSCPLSMTPALWICVAVPLYSLPVFLGANSFAGKWHHLHGSPGLSYTAASSAAKEGVAASVCDEVADMSMSPPCYPGLALMVLHPWIMNLLVPLLPPLVSMVGHAWQGKRSIMTAGRRFLKYLMWFLLFEVFYVLKPVIFRTLDSSDHVLVGVVGLAVAFHEVGCIWRPCPSNHEKEEEEAEEEEAVLGREWQLTVLLAAGLVWASKAYYVYWTCAYFHTPQESVVGFCVGPPFLWLCLWMDSLLPRLEPWCSCHWCWPKEEAEV